MNFGKICAYGMCGTTMACLFAASAAEPVYVNSRAPCLDLVPLYCKQSHAVLPHPPHEDHSPAGRPIHSMVTISSSSSIATLVPGFVTPGWPLSST